MKYPLFLLFTFSLLLPVFAATDTTSNTATILPFTRTSVMWDDDEGRFANPTNLPTAAEAATAAETAAALPALYDDAQSALDEALAPAEAVVAAQAARPVVTITGAVGFDNLLDRKNLTSAAVSNEWDESGTKLTSYIFSTELTAAPPTMEARAITDYGATTNWVSGTWDSHWGDADYAVPVTLTHQESYTNFVITGMVTNETTIVTTNEVDFTYTAYEAEVTTNAVTYTSVEYIESSGIQYIVTDFYPNNNANFTIEFSPMAAKTGGIWGCRASSGYSDETAFIAFYYDTNKIRRDVQNSTSTFFSTTFSLGSWYSFYWDNTKVVINDTTTAAIVTKTVPGYPFMLFNGSSAGGPYSTGSTARFRLFAADDAAGYKCDLRSALDPDGTPCMYDIINDKYYYNAGTGSFTYGGTPTETTHITSISTNYVPVTRTETRELILTNSVITVVDGTRPTIVLAGDTETFEAYRCTFDFSDCGLAAAHTPPIANPFVTVGKPGVGFDFANRDLIVNGNLAVTTNDLSHLGTWYFKGSDGEYYNAEDIGIKPWLDRGLLKITTRRNDK